MVGKLLVRGMLAGIAAGLLTFSFARLVGEPQVDQAISFEQRAHAAMGEAPEPEIVGRHTHAKGDAPEPEIVSRHTHAKADAPEPEIVSRNTQAGLGLLTGVVTYGAAIGGLFALTFAYAYGRVGKLGARQLSAWLALAAFITVVIVPNIKYPANPPSVGGAETIGVRTGLFFLMIAISIATMVFSLKVRKHTMARFGQWNASIIGGIVFVVIIGAVQFALPVINEVPSAFPAVLLWKFRVAAIGMQVIMWTTIGLLFGALAERSQRAVSAGRTIGKSAYL